MATAVALAARRCSLSAALSASSTSSSSLTATSARCFHATPAACKTQAGRYRATLNRTRPLTYEQSVTPDGIAEQKDFNSYNTAQLEDTFLMKEEMGQDLPHKILLEDMFIRRFMHGTWPDLILSEVIVKRQHNLVRVAAIIKRTSGQRTVYFLLGYTEELLSLWLKCPVKLELQTLESEMDIVYKYI